jgi:hypothetical protein
VLTGTEKQRYERSIERLRRSGWKVQGSSGVVTHATIEPPGRPESYFDTEGTLRENMPFQWSYGMPSRVQTAFACEGLVMRIDLEVDSGSAILLASRAGQSDLCRITQSFHRLKELGYFAEPDFCFTNSSGWSDISERSENDIIKAVFWNSQSHADCFDNEGTLIDDIPLQWAGDATVIEEILRETGMAVDAPENPKVTFFLGPAGEEDF